jgi:hypothetical protein
MPYSSAQSFRKGAVLTIAVVSFGDDFLVAIQFARFLEAISR